MFKRIIYDHWTEVVPMIAFFATFAVFLGAFVRALFMKKDRIEHLASLPLDNDPQPQQPPAQD